MRSPARPTTPPTPTSSITTMTAKSSAQLPRVAPCFSAQDAVLYLQRLLEAHLYAPPWTPSSEHTPLHQLLVNQYGPIASAQGVFLFYSHFFAFCGASVFLTGLSNSSSPFQKIEFDRLGAGLGTLQNIGLASSSEIRNTCQLRTQLTSTIYDFFETDQPL